MESLTAIVDYLDTELDICTTPDYGGALNGLQLENGGKVTRVATAVDATLPVIEKAIAAGADLLVVHHGMFWQGAQKLTGAQFKKIKKSIHSGLAIYSAHIPLDVHPRLGNNALLAQQIQETGWIPFFDYKGIKLGLRAQSAATVGEVADLVAAATGTPLLLQPRDRSTAAGTIGIITGGAGSEIQAISEQQISTFITGEAPHWAHGLAEERGVELILGGHYATETFGVKALGISIQERFGVKQIFIDHPSGL